MGGGGYGGLQVVGGWGVMGRPELEGGVVWGGGGGLGIKTFYNRNGPPKIVLR